MHRKIIKLLVIFPNFLFIFLAYEARADDYRNKHIAYNRTFENTKFASNHNNRASGLNYKKPNYSEPKYEFDFSSNSGKEKEIVFQKTAKDNYQGQRIIFNSKNSNLYRNYKEMVPDEKNRYDPNPLINPFNYQKIYTRITAYNSVVEQCDDDPCIAANGFDLCKHNTEDTVATNFLPFGTKVRIPKLFGDRIFIVRDRMNKRYKNKEFDIWMREIEDANIFGYKYAEVEILD
jgi:3D (Asp-Asp-Asp) domain-containing protein